MSKLLEKSLEYLDQSGKALGVADKMAEHVLSETTKAAALVPTAMERLQRIKLATGEVVLGTDQQKQALEKLATHSGTAEVLNEVLGLWERDKQAYQQQLALAQGTPTKAASAPMQKRAGDADDQGSGGYVGRVRGDGEQSAADKAFLTKLGAGHLVH